MLKQRQSNCFDYMSWLDPACTRASASNFFRSSFICALLPINGIYNQSLFKLLWAQDRDEESSTLVGVAMRLCIWYFNKQGIPTIRCTSCRHPGNPKLLRSLQALLSNGPIVSLDYGVSMADCFSACCRMLCQACHTAALQVNQTIAILRNSTHWHPVHAI